MLARALKFSTMSQIGPLKNPVFNFIMSESYFDHVGAMFCLALFSIFVRAKKF